MEHLRLMTYGLFSENLSVYCLENPHATLSMDDEFAYINISYGAERIWEEPLAYPIPCRLGNLGAGEKSFQGGYRIVGKVEQYITSADLMISGGFYLSADNGKPRYIKDCFLYCRTFKVKLPTETDRTLTILMSQLYQRGETITLTANSPDTEFDQRFLIFDFRTNKQEDIPTPPGMTGFRAPWQNPNQEYAGFGGLPALIQFPFPGNQSSPENLIQHMPKFYKPQNTWTKMDWLHYQLQESPRFFAPLSTVLPPNVFAATSSYVQIIFDLDGKFSRGGRAEKINTPTPFGFSGGAPMNDYSINHVYSFPHLLSFKEQLIGSGFIENNKLLKWYRIATSSFPIQGQVNRNP